MVNLLLKAGVAIDEVEEGELNSPLTFSASKGYKNTVILMIEKGANLNHVNSLGNCALFYAVKFNWVDVIKIILSHEEAQLKLENNDKLNPISLALNMNMTGVYQILVEELYRREVIIPTESTLKNSNKKQLQFINRENIPFRIENQSGFSVKNEYNSRTRIPVNNSKFNH
jgi:ankyrin repeat protein